MSRAFRDYRDSYESEVAVELAIRQSVTEDRVVTLPLSEWVAHHLSLRMDNDCGGEGGDHWGTEPDGTWRVRLEESN